MEPALEGDNLIVRLRSNLAQKAAYRVDVLSRSKDVELTPGESRDVAFDLGAPTEEAADLLTITLSAGQLKRQIDAG